MIDWRFHVQSTCKTNSLVLLTCLHVSPSHDFFYIPNESPKIYMKHIHLINSDMHCLTVFQRPHEIIFVSIVREKMPWYHSQNITMNKQSIAHTNYFWKCRIEFIDLEHSNKEKWRQDSDSEFLDCLQTHPATILSPL